WVGPFAFTTECAVIIPDYTADMSVNVPDACWDEAGSGDSTSGPMDLGASDWRDGTSYALGSSNAINLYSNVDSEWLLSPSFDLSTGGPYQLEVNVAVTNWNQGTVDDTMGSDDEVQLLMSTDGGTTWANVATWNAANEPPVGGIEYVEDLTAITGNVSFAIWATDGTVDDGEDYDFHVGKFRVRSIPSCADPATVMNTVLTDSASDFTWAIGGTETVWEYANLPSPSTEPVSGTSTMTTAASFTGLTPATDYDFYVRSDCGGSFSAWVLVSYSTPATPPANDDCANAIELTVNADETCTTTTPGTIVAATASGEDEASCSGTEDDDVWYSFVATAVSHNIDLLNVANGTTDLYHSVWSGSCGALTNLSCSDPNSSTVNGLTIGNTYLLRVYSWTATPGQTSTFDVCIGTPPPPPPAPANDECDNVVGLTVNLDYNNGIVTAGTTVGATASAQADDVSGTPNTDVWFSFVAIYDAHRVELLNVANQGGGTSTSTDMGMGVYDATGGCAGLVFTATSDPDTLNLTGLVAGTTYYVRVYGWFTSVQYNDFDISVGSDPALNVNNLENVAAFTYYPNPVKNTLTLNAQNTIENVTMYNMLGQEVLSATPNAVDSDLDMSSLQTGTYFVKVTIATVTKTIRVIKQ
uniref:T9SS type A sorting domain-containing protein n=1 Tax=uncultured Winogradskyella sp. TaxID=395353 RepID=UPI0030D7DF24